MRHRRMGDGSWGWWESGEVSCSWISKNICILKIYATLSKSVSCEGSGPFTCPLHNPHCVPMRSAVLVPVINSVAWSLQSDGPVWPSPQDPGLPDSAAPGSQHRRTYREQTWLLAERIPPALIFLLRCPASSCWLRSFCKRMLPPAWNTQDSPFSRLWPLEVYPLPFI